MEAPPGTGKSIVGKTFSNLFKKTYYLTATKGLQNQIIAKYSDVKSITGRSNHPCFIAPKLTSNKAKCVTEKEFRCSHKPKRIDTGFEYNFNDLCSYWKEKITAIEAKTSIHNYDYYIVEVNHVGDFNYPRNYGASQDLSELSLGIFDEAHNIGIKILKHYEINLSRTFFNSVGIPFPTQFENNDEIINWLQNVKEKEIPEQITILKIHLKSPTPVEEEQILIKLEKLEELSSKINLLLENYLKHKEIWMFIPKIDTFNSITSLKIIPVIISPFVENTLFRYFDRKLLLSSTFLSPQIVVNDLGLKGKRMNYISVPCPFPLEHRPIYPLNIGRLGYDELSLNAPKITKAVEIILNLFPNKKGNIHSNSYTLNNYVLDTLSRKSSERIISHRGEGLKSYQHALTEHLEADYPSVLMSPSIIEGIDLPGIQSEFQIIFKLFYDNLKENPQLEARKRSDPQYYEWLACVKTIQATGRPIRSMQDIAPTFYCDSRFGWFIKKNSELLSYWWKLAIQPTPNNYSFISFMVNEIVCTRCKKLLTMEDISNNLIIMEYNGWYHKTC